MQQILIIQDSYPVFILVLIPIATIYCGIFVGLSNHYILKPKIESYLYRSSISSNLIRQIIIDLLSSLAVITYAISAFLLTANNDLPIVLLGYCDLSWMTICLVVLLFWSVPQQAYSGIMFGKNVIMLLLCYVNIIYHYFSTTKLISLPVIFIGLYLINLILNAYQNKLKSFISQMLNLQMEIQSKKLVKCKSKMPTLQYLSQNYPVDQEEINKKIKQCTQLYQKQTKKSKLNRKLDTKILVRIKLLEIALNIHLSRKRLEEDQIQMVKEYYGHLNGTVTSQPIKKKRTLSISSQKNSPDNTYYNNLQIKNKIPPKRHQFMEQNQSQNINNIEPSNRVQVPLASVQQQQCCIFYLFPIRLFESSKIISNIFSIFINLGFGFLLNYSINIIKTVQFLSYLNFIYAILLLPFIPRISPVQYFSTMTLSSIWKYGVIGTMHAIAIAVTNQNGDSTTYNWQHSPMVQYQFIVNILTIIVGVIIVIGKKGSFKFLIVFAIAMYGINAGLQYLKVRPFK